MIGDDKHNLLKCLDCSRELADVVITKDSNEIVMTYAALCPFCGGQSALEKITGFVHVGSVEGTRLKTFETSNNRVVILLSKETGV